jgi:Na+-translocating ferredoxin:NAD+ oxidoreductase RnfD subunit
MKLRSIKFQLIFFLGLFAIYLAIKDKDLEFLLSTSIAVISTITIDSIYAYLKERKFRITDSSVISGLIIGYVISSDQPRWIFLSASLFAISSKHLIRFNKKHLFNPAAFGIFLTTILLKAQTQWKGTFDWYILIPFGLYFIYKIKKMEILLSYGLTAWALFGIQALMQKAPLVNIFGYLSYFYIFIMLIEPKTTPIKPQGKILFGIGVAALIFILIEVGAQFDTELFSLLILNLVVPFLNKQPNMKGVNI